MTKFQLFVRHWYNGCGASICPKASKICYARGILPCDVLFLGEAPGESENVLGKPFVGPAGRLLDRIVSRSIPSEVHCAFTNLVCCIPREEDGGKAGEPEDEDVLACQPRLKEFIELAEPRLIVTVGKLAKDWLDQGYKHSLKLPAGLPVVGIVHPASVLRANVAQQGLMVQRCVVTVGNAVREHVLGEGV